ncbi:hypothetical protein OG21DRAFT_1511820 [Imleria badia]|nr:hypothetical protein OG21DRAFT_1511820 [Imleria badia]
MRPLSGGAFFFPRMCPSYFQLSNSVMVVQPDNGLEGYYVQPSPRAYDTTRAPIRST